MRSLFFVLTMMISTLAVAGDNADAAKAVAEKIHKAFPRITIDGIREIPVSGLYEVQSGKNVFYSDENGDYVIFGGQIVETATQRNLTQERIDDLSRVDWNILPLDKAIVSGDKNAKLKVAIFTDPDCPYCKQLEGELKLIKGIKVYSFLFPLEQLHPDARAKSEAIWCSKNQHEALLKTILEGATIKANKCDTPLDDIAVLAKKIGINGTPFLIAGDGRIYPGIMDADTLNNWLSKK
jgi:thiol:disulfide interchange protein DsbC